MKYALVTIKHKWFVLIAGLKVGGIPLWRLIVHDWTKFTLAELPHYNRQFFGDKGDPQGFKRAWLHHQNHNPHHWNYWCMPVPYDSEIGGEDLECVPMPEVYVREMVADWMGAGRAYTGKWDLLDWLPENDYKMRMHPDTVVTLRRVLVEQGWSFADVNDLQFS